MLYDTFLWGMVMKITGIEYLPAGKYLFIKVHTDSGLYGLGEAGPGVI